MSPSSLPDEFVDDTLVFGRPKGTFEVMHSIAETKQRERLREDSKGSGAWKEAKRGSSADIEGV